MAEYVQRQPVEVRFVPLLTMTCLATFAIYFATAMRLPVVPLYAHQFGVTTAQIGVMNSVLYLIAGLLALPSGLLLNRIGRKRLAVTGALILAVGMGMLYLCHSFIQLTAVHLMLGIGIAAFGPTMMSFVAEISPPTHLGRAYGWYTTALFCGLGLGPAAGGAIGQALGLRSAFLLASVLAALAAVIISFFLTFRDGSAEDPAQAGNIRSDLISLCSNRPLLGCWWVTLGGAMAAGMFFTFMPLHANDRGLSVGRIGIIFLAYSVINALSRIPFGYWSDRVAQRKYLAQGGIVLVALALAGFGPAANFYHFLAAALCMGASMGLAFTSIGALIAETVSPRFRGAAMGGYNTCVYLGMMLGAVIFGPVIEAFGFRMSFMFTSISTGAFLVLFIWLTKAFRGRSSKAVP